MGKKRRKEESPKKSHRKKGNGGHFLISGSSLFLTTVLGEDSNEKVTTSREGKLERKERNRALKKWNWALFSKSLESCRNDSLRDFFRTRSRLSQRYWERGRKKFGWGIGEGAYFLRGVSSCCGVHPTVGSLKKKLNGQMERFEGKGKGGRRCQNRSLMLAVHGDLAKGVTKARRPRFQGG